MRRPNSTNLLLGFLGLCTVLSIGGAVSTSLAWYAYATRASLLYSGTSVFDNGQLQIGVKSAIKISDLVTAGMEEEKVGNNYYYFAPAGEGLSSEYLGIYLAARGYASNELLPVTSGQFDASDPNHNTHALLIPPNSEVPHPNATNNRASTEYYSQITFAFKVFSTNDQGQKVFAANRELWLTYVQTRASQASTGNVARSLRMYIHRDETIYGANNAFLFNPSSNESGATKVGGLLNLGYDDYFDFNDQGEILYGDYSIKEGFDNDGISTGPYNGQDLIYDINDKWDWETKENTEQNRIAFADSFTSVHSPFAPKYYPDLSHVDIKTAKYLGKNDVIQTKDSGGTLYNPTIEVPLEPGDDGYDPNDPTKTKTVTKKTSVCITGDEDANYIGEFDATIYLEGWDFSVTDEEQSHQFDFQLRFETNKVTENGNNNNNSSSNSNNG